MFLKSLFISGFKSFAYPTKIDFSDNISAIVGPNGSGKSNISDAIRFVLGEQRTRLMRSHSMQDIIFSGTDSENPRGVAHVQLVLGHEDRPDLVIERKYYRTGDSEYLLNGRKVRLKDIQAEFWDTGLGKNGYSIISQGGVENIVGAGPMELKELVEEAVGIAGYKVQQNETLRRLETIQSNIERVSDILDEMKKQLRPLKKNAEKTRQYLELSNTIRDIDLVSFYDKEIKFRNDQEELNSSIVDVNFSIMDIDKAAEEKDHLFIQNKEKRNQLEEENNNLSQKLEQLKNNQTGKLLLTNNIERDIQNYQIRKDQLNYELKQLKSSSINDQEKLKTFKNLYKEQETLFLSLKEKSEEQERNLNQTKKELEELKQESGLEKINQTETKLNQEVIKKIEIETELRQIENINKTNHEKIKVLDQERQALETKLNTFEEQNKSLSEKKDSLEKQLNEGIKKENEISLKLNQTESQIDSIKRNIDYQVRLKESYSGFSEAVRSVMTQSRVLKLNSVYGTVSDLFSTDQKFQTAIQIALGYSAQNIVVKDTHTAQILIDYLKKSKKGRATFLPLESVKGSSGKINYSVLKLPGVIGFADNLIECENRFKKVFNRLLGRTLVVEDFNSAKNIRTKAVGLTIVTLSGECFYSSGAIVGGSIKKTTTQIFHPQQEIDRLEKEKSKLLQNKSILSDQKTEIARRRRQQEESYATFKQKLTEVDKEILNIQNNILLNQSKKSQLNLDLSKVKSLKNDLRKTNDRIGNLTKKIDKLKKNSEKVAENEKKLSSKILSYQEALANCKINENKAYQDSLVTKGRVNDLEKNISKNNQKTQSINNEIIELEQSIKDSKKKLEVSRQDKNENSKNLDSLENKIEANRNLLLSLNHEALQIEEELKDLNRSRANEVEARSKLERKLDKIEYEQKNLQESIFEKYQLNFVMIKDQIGLLRAQKKDLSRSELNQLKKELREIGSVNINAIEDYNELKERYDKLNENYNDLNESKQDIEKTIENLNQTMSNQFKNQFEKLNKLFSEAFTILFEGGKARLDYTDKNDILNSGIQLFAQPPGKHLKHINLLSGGEKAMTAIALLFAFIQLNPSPFVIIDEIDAALDDNNINRFTNYIQRVKQDNQFIVITHRKGTVQMCENIHGVSMAADGISRCCSFEISDYLE